MLYTHAVLGTEDNSSGPHWVKNLPNGHGKPQLPAICLTQQPGSHRALLWAELSWHTHLVWII